MTEEPSSTFTGTLVDQKDVPLDTSNAGLLALALTHKSGMDIIERLAAMKERAEARQAEAAFNEAMARVQAKLPIVLHDAENTHTRSSYAKLEAILASCKPVWLAEGFSLSFGELPGARDGWVRTECCCRHSGGHSVKSYVDLPQDGKGAKGGASSMNEVQAVLSTGTYAERRLTIRAFNIVVAGEDLDGNKPDGELTGPQIETLNNLLTELEGTKPAVNLRDLVEVVGGIVPEGDRANVGHIPAKEFWTAFRLLNKRQPDGKRWIEADVRKHLEGGK